MTSRSISKEHRKSGHEYLFIKYKKHQFTTPRKSDQVTRPKQHRSESCERSRRQYVAHTVRHKTVDEKV